MTSLRTALCCLAALAGTASSAGSSEAIVLKANVGDAVTLELVDSRVDYVVSNLTGDDIFSGTTTNARFQVAANTAYRLVVTFPTWQPGRPAGRPVRQPAFSNGTHLIGGRLYLDPSPDVPGTDDIIYQRQNGVLLARGSSGLSEWGIGADISAGVTDNPTGLAAPGVYSLDAEITVQPW